jgi:hypothetical protein
MKHTLLITSLVLLVGCAHTTPNDFVQGRLRITPPVQTKFAPYVIKDGGTRVGTLTDARGKTFTFYIDRRIRSTTRGAIYIGAYPGERKSILIANQAEFEQKLGSLKYEP